ncbi:hypothetical protein JOQ06_024323 [Pogonophryne albipinna]|uniref:Zinc transporter ZIP6 n=1 Tax=Pogonophryne albipinna TaxID=1090488 RepID=A0AAD6F458_9TELE|nr:hypothetical protein JOQ06_024323 [Pogonophryne albipinna]
MLLLLTFLLAVRLCGAATVVPECTTESSSAVRSLSAGVDALRAEQSQRQHLEALFNRYGENGSISLAGLKLLLQNVGLDRNRSVTSPKTSEVSKDQDSLQDRKSVSSAVFSAQMMVKSDENQETNGTPEEHDQINHNIPHNHSEDSVECLNASTLLSSHGMSSGGSVSFADFSFLCPALLHQIDDGACIRHRSNKHVVHVHVHHGNQNASEQEDQPGGEIVKNVAIAWVGGFLSITVISLLSLLGVVLIPLMNKVFFKFLLSFLVALAVGTLSGDAFLHLIPHSQGGHHHHKDSGMNDSGHEPHEEENLDGDWKGLTALSGVYIMFLIEHFLTLGKMRSRLILWRLWSSGALVLWLFVFQVQKKWDQNDKADPEKQLALEDLKPAEEVETNGAAMFGAPSLALRGGSEAEEQQVMLEPEVSIVSAPEESVDNTAEDCENKCHSHLHDTHFQQAGVATLAWMVIMGDGLHNFSDGLAIGAAFTEGLSTGLSTSVAVFCHELPHELGDFAVLLKAGMTVRQAILYNGLSALMAYLGVVIGILIGHYAENVSMWVFALTAGLFLYVALVDMVSAAFTEGLSTGLSTSVAVFCHELPHELGDFAVLLKAGMTVRQAILYNGLSALMAYLGVVIGILIGHYAENVSMWVFALTAGLFLYVALVDMVPEMLHNDAGDHGFSHCGFFLLQNAGILLGFCIMLLIAIFEHKIQLDLGY